MSYILLDESGDLGFKMKKGSSRFFVTTIIFTKSKRSLEKVVKSVHHDLHKRFRKVGMLHAYKEKPATRIQLLEKLAKQDCAILPIILDKQKERARLPNEKKMFYNYIANILLDHFFEHERVPIPINEPVILIASQRETNTWLNFQFRDYLAQGVSSKYHVDIQITIATPRAEKSLQAVDFASWAIFRKWEKGDDSYYNIIRSKVIDEVSLLP